MLRRLRHLFDHLIHRRRVEDELNEEVEASFAMTVDRFVAEGMSLSAARRAARIEFVGVEQVKEKIRDGLVGSALRLARPLPAALVRLHCAAHAGIGNWREHRCLQRVPWHSAAPVALQPAGAAGAHLGKLPRRRLCACSLLRTDAR